MPNGSQIVLFSERVVNLWNSLDDQSLTASSLNCFKSNLTDLENSSWDSLWTSLFVDPRGCPVLLVGLIW